MSLKKTKYNFPLLLITFGEDSVEAIMIKTQVESIHLTRQFHHE